MPNSATIFFLTSQPRESSWPSAPIAMVCWVLGTSMLAEVQHFGSNFGSPSASAASSQSECSTTDFRCRRVIVSA